MNSQEYRGIISRIIRVTMKKHFPLLAKNGSPNGLLAQVSKQAALAIHARMYGANVDGVASPIWRSDGDQFPRIDASEILKEGEKDEKVSFNDGSVSVS